MIKMKVHLASTEKSASSVKQCQMKLSGKSKANLVIQILSTCILYALRSIVFFQPRHN